MIDWKRIEEVPPPVSTPLDQKWVLAQCPNDDWSPLGTVHIACFYEHDCGKAKVYGSNSARYATHWAFAEPPQ